MAGLKLHQDGQYDFDHDQNRQYIQIYRRFSQVVEEIMRHKSEKMNSIEKNDNVVIAEVRVDSVFESPKVEVDLKNGCEVSPKNRERGGLLSYCLTHFFQPSVEGGKPRTQMTYRHQQGKLSKGHTAVPVGYPAFP